MRGFAASEVHWLLVGCQKGVQFHSLVSAPLINTAENRQTFILQQKFKAFWKLLMLFHTTTQRAT